MDGSTVAPLLGTFATVPEIIELIPGADNYITPSIILLPLDVASADPVDPLQTSIITSSRFQLADGSLSEPVTLTIPAGAAVKEDGSLYAGDIHISRIEDPTQGPRPLPDDIGLSVYIAMQPFGVLYPNPVPISFPNIEGFPAESIMDVFALNHATGEFEKIGEARVSTDGKTVDSIGGIVKSNSWHGITPQAASVSQSGTTGDQNNQKDACNSVACTFNHESGNLGEDHSLPSYYSLGQARTVRLNYNSMNANPRPILNATSTIGNFSPPPSSMSSRLTVGGIEQGGERFSLVSTEPATVRGQFKAARPSVQFNAELFETGIYNYSWIVDCHFPISRRSETLTGQVIINNAGKSALGAGWTLSGLRRIHVNSEGLALMTEGNSVAITFKPIDGISFTSPPADFSILTRNPDNSYTRRMKDGTLYHFDARGFQIQMVDRNNNITQYIYDSQDRIQRIVDPVAKEFVFNYNSAGYLDSISDAANRSTHFEHDSEGNLTRIIEPTGDQRRFEYQPVTHLLTAQTDQRNNRKEYTFDFAGRISSALLPDNSVITLRPSVTSGLIDPNSGIGTSKDDLAPVPPLVEDINNSLVDLNGNLSSSETDERSAPTKTTDAVGRITLTRRDADSNPTRTTRPNLSVIDRVYDNQGNVLSQTEQFNTAKTIFTYDAFSLITSMTNPNNHQTTLNRNLVTGNIESIVNHLGHITTMQYDSRGLVIRMLSPNGLESVYTYNSQGLPETLTETPPAGSPGNVRLTQYSYDAAGQLTQTITPDGIILDMVYDNKGRLSSVTDNLNQSIQYTYDGYNNLIQTDTESTDGSLALMVSREYDSRNRLFKTRAPHSSTEDSVAQQILDNNSNLTGLIDPNANPSSNQFDGEDRLIENTHRLNGIMRYEYDTNDRIIKVVAPNNVETTYTYDVLGRRETETSPDRGTLSYTYDLANNIKSITEGRGITATMSYDELERVKTKTYPNTLAGKIEDITYSYDTCAFGLGYLCSRTDESGSYDYDYDAYGNMTSGIFTEIEGTVYTMSYVYDDGDHVIQSTYPSGRVVDYARDGVRRVEAIDTTFNGSAQNIISNVQYRGDNQMLSCNFGNGTKDTRTYDLQGRLRSQQLNNSLNAMIDQRSYDYDKNSNILSINTNTEDNAYLYDKLDRVTKDTINADTPINFTYDLNDNRLSRNLEDASREQIITHFADSNRIDLLETLQIGSVPIESLPSRELIYNDAGRLFQLYEDGSLKADYFYNDQGQRTRKVIHNPDLTTSITIFHYDHMGYLITETDEQGNLIKDYIWQEGMYPVAQIENNAGTEPIIYLYTDHLMTNRLATDQNQNIVWRWEGEAFGNTQTQELVGVSVNLRFPGQYFDRETGWFYNWNRYYDPHSGRYITSDPIGLAGGLNTYTYAGGNPLGYIDPTGEFVCGGACIIGAISIGISIYDAYQTLTDECLSTEDKARRFIVDAALGVAGGALIKGSLKVIKVTKWGMNNPVVKAAAARGREAHKEFAKRVKQKPGWQSEKTITGPNGEKLRPDALTPSGRPVELKPNTPSGRRQGAKQIEKYKAATGTNGRVIYYDP